MKSNFKRSEQPNLCRLFSAALLLAAALVSAGCGGASQATPTPQIVTVVQTVPVEVTRMVEVVNTVEVTRQVVVTVVVEVPVTPEATPTATRWPTQPAATISYLPTSTALAQEFSNPKTAGISRLKIINASDETLTAKGSGPQSFEVELSSGRSAFLNVPFGEYTIRVYQGNDRLYTVRVTCVNPDKYEITLHGDNATVMAP